MSVTKTQSSQPTLTSDLLKAVSPSATKTTPALGTPVVNSLSSFAAGATRSKVDLTGQASEGDRRSQIDSLSLSSGDRQKLDADLSGKNGSQAKADAQKILDQTRGLKASDVAPLVHDVVTNPGDAKHVASILSSPSFQKMTPDQQAKLLSLMLKGDPKDKSYLGSLDKLAQSGALTQTDKDGHSLLDNLTTLSSEPLNPSLSKSGVTHAQLVSQVVDTCADPNRVHQSDYKTCSVASMEYATAQRDPAEYARIIGGLSSQSGSVTLKGGGTLQLQTNYYDHHKAGDHRSTVDAMFQNSAMALGAQADNESYDASTDTLTHATPPSGSGAPDPYKDHHGLTSKEEASVASQLFGADYKSWTAKSEGDGARQAKWLAGYHGKDPVTVNVKLPNGNHHAVEYDHSEGDKLYFRNSYHDNKDHPPFHYDAKTGALYLTQKEYSKVAVSVVAPPSEGPKGSSSDRNALPVTIPGVPSGIRQTAEDILNDPRVSPFVPDDDSGNGHDGSGTGGIDPGNT